LVGGVLFLPLVALGDARILAGLAAWRTPYLDMVMEVITRLGYGGVDIGILVAMGLFGWWRGDRGLRARGLVGGAAVAGAGLVDQVLKNLVCRARPNALGAGTFFSDFPCFPAPYANASFPSGHATTAFAAAVLLALWYPRWSPAWIGLAALVSLSRVLLGSHFPSDVLAGALLGSGMALIVHDRVAAVRRTRPAGRGKADAAEA
jgi:undecaprenyl-diphosphatase